MQKLLEAYDKDALKKINEICEQLIKYNAIIQKVNLTLIKLIIKN